MPKEPPEQTTGWQSMAMAPRDGTKVLLWDGATMLVCRWLCRWESWVEVWCHDEPYDNDIWPVCWMPLPKPPDEEDYQRWLWEGAGAKAA